MPILDREQVVYETEQLLTPAMQRDCPECRGTCLSGYPDVLIFCEDCDGTGTYPVYIQTILYGKPDRVKVENIFMKNDEVMVSISVQPPVCTTHIEMKIH